MAQGQGFAPDNTDPLDILREGLTRDQISATEETAVKLIESSKQMVINQAQSQSVRIMRNPKGFGDEALSKLTDGKEEGSDIRDILAKGQFKEVSFGTTPGPGGVLYDADIGGKYVGTMPAGSKVTSKTSNIVTRTMPDGSVELFVKQTTPEVPPAKVFQSVQEAASRPQGTVFNLENEEAKIRDLTGEDRLNAVSTLLSNLDAQITKGRQRIGQTAAIQSGNQSAQTALDRALQMEQLPNPAFGGLSFAQRFGVPSAQTIQAQEFLRATQIQMTQLESSMTLKDPEVMKYVSAKERLMKIEARTADRQARAEDKEAQFAQAIPQHQNAAWRALYPGTTAEEANKQIAAASKNNKPDYIATLMTSDNVYSTLMHSDLAVREKALTVLRNHDRANNAGFETAEKTPTTEMLSKFIKNPAMLEQEVLKIGAMTPEEIQTMKAQATSIGTTQSAQEKKSLEQRHRALLLEKYFEKATEKSYTNDMRKWKSNETGANTPLGMIIAGVSKSNVSGQADMPTVIAKYIQDPTVVGPDGQPLPYEQRVQVLQSALTGTAGNEFKTMLYPDMTALHTKLANDVTITAARARVNATVSGAYSGIFTELRFPGVLK